MTTSRRRHQDHEGHENSERWLLTYADLITLLMVFFVIMYSLGRTDAKRFGAVAAAMERAFNVGVLSGRASELGVGSGGSPVEVAVVPFMTESGGRARLLQSQLARIAQISGAGQAVTVMPHPEGLLVRVAGNLLFDSGKADLNQEGLAFLDNFAALMGQSGEQIRIEGHTDSIPIDSVLYPTNWELSTSRAVTVLRYLSEYGGLAASRLSAAGYGDQRPIATNLTRDGRAANRRVDIVIIQPAADAGLGTRIDTGTLVPAEGGRGR